jgi:hypothetical protein
MTENSDVFKGSQLETRSDRLVSNTPFFCGCQDQHRNFAEEKWWTIGSEQSSQIEVSYSSQTYRYRHMH